MQRVISNIIPPLCLLHICYKHNMVSRIQGLTVLPMWISSPRFFWPFRVWFRWIIVCYRTGTCYSHLVVWFFCWYLTVNQLPILTACWVSVLLRLTSIAGQCVCMWLTCLQIICPFDTFTCTETGCDLFFYYLWHPFFMGVEDANKNQLSLHEFPLL